MSPRARELTPAGTGAVSVVRVSGAGALEALRSLSLDPGLPIASPSLVRLRADGEELDEAIVCVLSPEEVEIHLHGSPPLVRRVLASFVSDPSPAAEIETVEELAHDLLADAPCEAAARILLDQAEGALARGLRSLASMSETERGRAIDALLERWRIARRALRPATVVIAGRANAGKSTLFNALLGEDRAIVDAEPGTTRDLNRARARLGSWPVILVDTAGQRELGAGREEPPSQASVELRGQARARAAREAADLVLWLEPLEPVEPVPSTSSRGSEERTISIRTCADRAAPDARPARSVSALVEPLRARETVAAAFRERLDLPEDPWSPGMPLPFTEELAIEVEGLRRVPRASLTRAIEAVLRRASAPPPSGCPGADVPVRYPPGIA